MSGQDGREGGLSPPGTPLLLHRQLEAIVRIAEALSKMKLQPFAAEADVEEALRLFQVSTLDAALSGTLSGEQTQSQAGRAMAPSSGLCGGLEGLLLLCICRASLSTLLARSPSLPFSPSSHFPP